MLEMITDAQVATPSATTMHQTKKNKIQHRNTTKAKEQNKKKQNSQKSSLKIGKMQTTSIVEDDHGHTSCNTKRNNNTLSKKQERANIVKEKYITTKLIDN
jgi:hypothetical protein